MNVISQITIDLAAAQVPPVVYAKQYDEGTRIVEVQLTNQGVPYEIPDGVTAVFYMAKPDGKFVFYDSGESGPAVSVSGSAVSVTLLAPALQAAGTGKAQVSLYNETGKLSTFNFDVVIQPAAVPDDAISTDYVNVLTQTVQQAINAAAAAAASAKAAEDAAAAVTDGAVRYDTAQALTDQQKAQARENIGADAAGAVKYSEAQTLTEEQQAQARENIGAVPTTRTVNEKTLSDNVFLTATDVGAVPITRTINKKTLSGDIELTATDVGALSAEGVGAILFKSTGNDQYYAYIVRGTDGANQVAFAVEYNNVPVFYHWNNGSYKGGWYFPADIHGTITVTSSAKRYKTDIAQISPEEAEGFVMSVEPIKFRFNEDVDRLAYGFLAEDMERENPNLCLYRDGRLETVRYHEIYALYAKQVQYLTERVKELEFKLQGIEGENDA